MNDEKNNNLLKAAKVWHMIKRGKRLSEISLEIGLHKSEISNIKKFTSVEMYIRENLEKQYIDELLEKRKLVKQYEHDLKKCRMKLQSLHTKLEECQRTWWQKFYEKWS